MKIKKIGHCCLYINVSGLNILTDPGNFSSGQNNQKEIDLILITHEHADHLHVDSLRLVLENNPKVKVVTNSAVGKLLSDQGIEFTILEGNESMSLSGVTIQAFDCKHEEIFGDFGQVQNTGYLIDGKLFYPGDSFCKPGKPVDVLALPVAGPWCKIGDAINYAIAVKPRVAFPVHDGMLSQDKIGGAHAAPKAVLPGKEIEFVPMLEGDEMEFSV